MLITVGKFRRSILYKKYLGKRPIERVMKGGKRIWPDGEERLYAMTVELPKEGTDDWAYWQHMEAGLDEGIDLGTEYWCGWGGKASRLKEGWELIWEHDELYYMKKKGVPNLNVGRVAWFKLDGMTWVVDKRGGGDAGNFFSTTWRPSGDTARMAFPYLVLPNYNCPIGVYKGAIKVGDYIEMHAIMPVRVPVDMRILGDWLTTRSKVTINDFNIPIIPDTKFPFAYDKAGKSTPVGLRVIARGLPSKEEYVNAWGNMAGHKSLRQRGTTPPGGCGNWGNTCTWNNRHVPGDTGMQVQLQPHMSDGWGFTACVFPAFKKVIRMKVIRF